MTDHFQDKAQDWEQRETIKALSNGIGKTLLSRVSLMPDMEIMDFGAGTGLLSGHVAPHVKKIIAVDISRAMLDQLSRKSEFEGKVVGVCQDIVAQPLERTFDMIVSAMALHHVEDTQALFLSFAKHLKPGGQIALADLDQEDGSFHPSEAEGVYHFGFDRAELQAKLLQAGFENVQWTTAHKVHKGERIYPVFVVTAIKG